MKIVWITGSINVRYADGIHYPEMLLSGLNTTKDALIDIISPTGAKISADMTEELARMVNTEIHYRPPLCRLNHTCE